MQEPHRILPPTIPTPPVTLEPHFALPKSPPVLAHPWPPEPQETRQVGDPTFFSCSKSLIPAGVGTLASRSQEGPTLQAASTAALGTPGRGQARRDASESSLAQPPLSLSIRCTQVFVASLLLPSRPAPAKAELSAPRSWETRPGRSPLGRHRGAGLDLLN